MEVHQAGGGINFTVEKTRAASEAELLGLLMKRLERMLGAGKLLFNFYIYGRKSKKNGTKMAFTDYLLLL